LSIFYSIPFCNQCSGSTNVRRRQVELFYPKNLVNASINKPPVGTKNSTHIKVVASERSGYVPNIRQQPSTPIKIVNLYTADATMVEILATIR